MNEDDFEIKLICIEKPFIVKQSTIKVSNQIKDIVDLNQDPDSNNVIFEIEINIPIESMEYIYKFLEQHQARNIGVAMIEGPHPEQHAVANLEIRLNSFDREWLTMDAESLMDQLNQANFLQLEELVDLISCKVTAVLTDEQDIAKIHSLLGINLDIPSSDIKKIKESGNHIKEDVNDQ